MKKGLYLKISLVILAVVILTSFAKPSFAGGGGKPHKDEEPHQQTIIKKEGEKENNIESEPKEETKTEEREQYQVELFLEPAQLIKGEAKLVLELATQKGERVKDAEASALIEMEPAMEGHGAMDIEPVKIKFSFDKATGQYYGLINFNEIGKYNASFSIKYPDGQSEDFNTELEVIYDGPNIIFLSSISVIILVSIITAQIIKNRANNVAKEGIEDVRA